MIGKIAASMMLAVSAFGLVGSPALADPTPPPPPPPSSDELAPLSPEERDSLGPEAQAKLSEPEAAAAAVPACGTREPNVDRSSNGDFKLRGVKIRTGPRLNCTPVGEGFPGQGADYYCYSQGQGGTWTYLRDKATGKQGWVKDIIGGKVSLKGAGSFVKCPR